MLVSREESAELFSLAIDDKNPVLSDPVDTADLKVVN